MSELVGRFLSFEDHLGRGLVKFVYYVLLFLLVVTTIFELVMAVVSMFSGEFWAGLWAFFVIVPLSFLVKLLLLRVGAELVIAILSIDDNLRLDGANDTISTGLNPVTPPRAAPTMTAPVAPAPAAESSSEPFAEGADDPVAPKPPAKKAPARKRRAKKSTKKAAAGNGSTPSPASTSTPSAEPDTSNTGPEDKAGEEKN
jgi:hypothetical protein